MEISINFTVQGTKFSKDDIKFNKGKFKIDIGWKLKQFLIKFKQHIPESYIDNNKINICLNNTERTIAIFNIETYNIELSQKFKDSLIQF